MLLLHSALFVSALFCSALPLRLHPRHTQAPAGVATNQGVLLLIAVQALAVATIRQEQTETAKQRSLKTIAGAPMSTTTRTKTRKKDAEGTDDERKKSNKSGSTATPQRTSQTCC